MNVSKAFVYHKTGSYLLTFASCQSIRISGSCFCLKLINVPLLSSSRWDVWSGDREKERAPCLKPTSSTGKAPLNSATLTSLNAMATSRGSSRYVQISNFGWTNFDVTLAASPRISSTIPAVVPHWPKWPSVIRTASRRGPSSSSPLRVSTRDSSSTVARRVRGIFSHWHIVQVLDIYCANHN